MRVNTILNLYYLHQIIQYIVHMRCSNAPSIVMTLIRLIHRGNTACNAAHSAYFETWINYRITFHKHSDLLALKALHITKEENLKRLRCVFRIKRRGWETGSKWRNEKRGRWDNFDNWQGVNETGRYTNGNIGEGKIDVQIDWMNRDFSLSFWQNTLFMQNPSSVLQVRVA